MTLRTIRVHLRHAATLAIGVAITASAACAGTGTRVPTDVGQADRYLHDKGTEALAGKKWLRAREYFRQLYDGYPQSAYRPDAKLGLGDAYLGEGSAEALVLAQNEFSEFLTFYPSSRRADYAQYRLGMTHFKQMLNSERDQTQTREAVAELEAFVARYPKSALASEVKSKLRAARDRLSESEYRVGVFYHRVRWYPGSIERLKSVLEDDPEFTSRDGVHYYLGESLVRLDRKAEALPHFDRIVQEFLKSEYLERAKKRVAELKAELAMPAAADPKKAPG